MQMRNARAARCRDGNRGLDEHRPALNLGPLHRPAGGQVDILGSGEFGAADGLDGQRGFGGGKCCVHVVEDLHAVGQMVAAPRRGWSRWPWRAG